MVAQTNANIPTGFAITRASDSSAFDLTGLRIKMQFKSARGSAAAFEASTDNGLLVVNSDPTTGTLTRVLQWSVLEAAGPGNYRYDAVLLQDDDNETFLWSGILPIASGTTNDATRYLPGITALSGEQILQTAAEIKVAITDPDPSLNPLIQDLYLAPRFGNQQVYYRGRELSFVQGSGNSFGTPTWSVQPTLVSSAGHDPLYPSGVLRVRDLLNTTAGGILWIIIFNGQSNNVGATQNLAGQADPTVLITAEAPLPNKLFCFNGGVTPHQLGVNNDSDTIAIASSQYVSVVPAKEGINPLVQRETWSMPFGETFAANVKSADQVFLINTGHGSSKFADLVWNSALSAKSQPWKDGETLLSAAVNYALTNNLTPRVLVAYNGNESNSADAQTIANWTANLAILRTLADGLKSFTGQTAPVPIILPLIGYPRDSINHDPPSNEFNDSQTTVNMGKVSNVALGTEYYCRVTDPWAFCFSLYHQQGGGPTHGEDAAIHYATASHSLMGELGANIALDVTANGSYHHPSISNVRRIVESPTTVLADLSESAILDTTFVADPGQKGLKYTDSGGTIAVSTVAVDNNQNPPRLTITLATTPSNSTEELDYACGNATKFADAILGPWPTSTNPQYGLGRTQGQRGNLRELTPRYYSQRTGRPLHRGFAHQQNTVTVRSSQAGIYAALQALGLTTGLQLCLDFGDSACLASSSAQTLTDLSTNGNSFYRGLTSGSESQDPSISGTIGGLAASTYLGFDGTQSCVPTGSPTFLDSAHKAGAQFVAFMIGYLPSSPGANQHFLANCIAGTGTGAGNGISFGTNSAGQPRIAVFSGNGATSTSVLTQSSGALPVTFGQLYFHAVGIDALNGVFWRITTADGLENGTCSYTSPASSGPEGNPRIGKNGSVILDSISTRLKSGTRLYALGWVNNYLPGEAWVPFWRTMQQRFTTI